MEQMSLFPETIPVVEKKEEEVKITKNTNKSNATKDNQAKEIVNKEQLKELTSIFQNIRIVNFIHDYQADYRIIGSVLKNAKNYNYVKVKDLLMYFQKYGLKEIEGNLIGFLTWAFLHTDVAKQPYNTIDLQRKKQEANNNGQQLPSREKYNKRFENLG